jgi:hypothetical protein
VRWLLLATGAERVRAQWPADVLPSVCSHSDEWLIFDERGRVLSFNVGSSARQSFCVR